MGDKKQKEIMIKKAKQGLVIGACILFVVLMILSGMGSSWLTMFTVIKPGDSVVVDYTLYDLNGNPVLTSNQQTYTRAVTDGRNILVAKQLSFIPGQNLSSSIYPVSIYTMEKGWTQDYALFSLEYEAINQALVGMKTGDQKRIRIPNLSMTQQWSATQLGGNGVNFTQVKIGDVLAMGVSDNPDAADSNSSSIRYSRYGQVINKNDEGVVVDFGYPTADISIVSINANT